MALKRCIGTDSRLNKNTPSRASLEMAEILWPKSSTKRMAVSLIGPRVSSATGWNIKEAGISSYMETFLAAANSAAAPAVVADWWIYESASVDVTVAWFRSRPFMAQNACFRVRQGFLGVSMTKNNVWVVRTPQKHDFDGLNSHFKPSLRNFRIAISRKVRTRSTRNLKGNFRCTNGLRGWSSITKL